MNVLKVLQVGVIDCEVDADEFTCRNDKKKGRGKKKSITMFCRNNKKKFDKNMLMRLFSSGKIRCFLFKCKNALSFTLFFIKTIIGNQCKANNFH